MFVVTGKQNGVVWDAKNDRPLAKFQKGRAEVEDKATAKQLQDMGYEVEGGLPDDAPKGLEDMKVDELKAYAKEQDIDLGGVTKKEDILAKIREAEAGME